MKTKNSHAKLAQCNNKILKTRGLWGMKEIFNNSIIKINLWSIVLLMTLFNVGANAQDNTILDGSASGNGAEVFVINSDETTFNEESFPVNGNTGSAIRLQSAQLLQKRRFNPDLKKVRTWNIWNQMSTENLHFSTSELFKDFNAEQQNMGKVLFSLNSDGNHEMVGSINISKDITANRFHGDGSGLTNLPNNSVWNRYNEGTQFDRATFGEASFYLNADPSLSAPEYTFVLNGNKGIHIKGNENLFEGNLNVNQTVSATAFVGDGSGLTNLPSTGGYWVPDASYLTYGDISIRSINDSDVLSLIAEGGILAKGNKGIQSRNAIKANGGYIEVNNDFNFRGIDIDYDSNISIRRDVDENVYLINTNVFNHNTLNYEPGALVLQKNMGNVGIGKIPNAAYKMDVNGIINVNQLYINDVPFNPNSGSSLWTDNGSSHISYSSGRVGIGTNSPNYTLDVMGTFHIAAADGTPLFLVDQAAGTVQLGGHLILPNDDDIIHLGDNNLPANLTNYRMYVEEGVATESVKVTNTTSWSDFVFYEDYNLKPLEQVANFIEENKHLPDVPSQKDIEDKGYYDQHEINKVLLQKIEELTLYVIDQQAQIKAQHNEIESLKVKN